MSRKKNQKKTNKKLNIISKLTATCTIIGSCLFVFVLVSMGILPSKYLMMIIGLLSVTSLLFGVIAFHKGVNKFNKIIQSAICTVLAFLLMVSSIGIEIYKDKIRNIFTNTETITLYVYTLKDSSIKTIDDLANHSIGLSTFTNQEVQDAAIADITTYFSKYELGSVETNTFSGIFKVVDALFNHEVDSIMVQENMIDILEELDEYKDFDQKVKAIYESTHKVTIKRSDASFVLKNITKDPFVVAVGGRDYNEHFDVNMVVTVNPVTKQVLIVTVPRDAYSPLDGDKEKMDKLSYTGKLGSDVWLKTLQLFFDYDFNFFGIVDFYSIGDVIDAIGGIDIYNPYFFTAPSFLQGKKKYYFYEGDLHLDGMGTLAYCRERQSLAHGDLSRNEHQGIVLKALIKKITSPDIINKADTVLNALEDKITTDFTPELIYKLVNMQIKDNAEWNIVTYNISGELFYTYSYMIGHEYGPNYAMMDLNQNDLKKANDMIRQVLDGETPIKN